MIRKSSLSAVILALLLVIMLSVTVFAAPGESFELRWWTIDSGGRTASGGTYSLNGTIGQPDSGEMLGGSYRLVGGFWNSAISGPLLRNLYLPLVNR